MPVVVGRDRYLLAVFPDTGGTDRYYLAVLDHQRGQGGKISSVPVGLEEFGEIFDLYGA